MNQSIDLTGKRFGRLVVIKYVHKDKSRNHKWLCECDCKNKRVVREWHLRNGETKSCGCLRTEIITKHGHYKNNKQSKEYRA